MDTGSTGLNPSSLIDLKAELSKKYESFNKAKLTQNLGVLKRTPFKNKGEDISKVKKPISVPKCKEEDAEEELALRKSRLALEAKAKLYEKITSNHILIDDEENEHYLVDFQRKVLYDTPESKTPFMNNTTDASNSAKTGTSNLQNIENSEKVFIDKELHSEKPREKFEKLDSDQPIHYQTVQHNEVRDHGTGYFAFSTDEAKRKEQMEELSNLRQETETQRLQKQRMLRKRKAGLQARLAKICERRNIDKTVVEAYAPTEDPETLEDLPQVNTTDLSNIPLPEPPEVSEKKEPKIRPWDIGKTDLYPPVSQKHKIKTQSDWIEEKRSERPSEFAPPTFYTK